MYREQQTSRYDRRQPRWRVLYDGEDITVTSWYLLVYGLRVPMTAVTGARRRLTYGYPRLKVSLIVAAAELVIGLPLAVVFSSILIAGAAVLSVIGVVLAVWRDAQRNPVWMEIEARVGDEWVVIFGTRDQTRYNQVVRALIRAMEDKREPLP